MTTLVAEANKVEIPGVGVMVILDSSGDIKRGMQAWSVTRKGDKDRKITEFDPEAEKIIFSPALVGG